MNSNKKYQFKDKTIIVVSNEPWGDIWYSKHNYAYELSKQNEVYFVNGPEKWSPLSYFKKRVRFEKWSDSLTVVKYTNYFPVVTEWLSKWNNTLISKKIQKGIAKRDPKEIIFWTFDPIRLYKPSLFKPSFRLFHCVDLYQDLFHIYELCSDIDKIVLVSEVVGGLYDQFPSIPKAYVPHGISADNFSLDEHHQLDIDHKDYALFIGVLDDRIDVPLFRKAVEQHPELPFVVVGPYGRTGEKDAELHAFFDSKEYPNLHVIGPRHFQELKYYIHNAKVCLTFMDPTLFGNDIGHHKTLVYLSQGKPIVGYAFKEYRGHEDIMYMAETHEENLQQLKNLLENGEDEGLIQKRLDFAKSYVYENQIQKIEDFINRED